MTTSFTFGVLVLGVLQINLQLTVYCLSFSNFGTVRFVLLFKLLQLYRKFLYHLNPRQVAVTGNDNDDKMMVMKQMIMKMTMILEICDNMIVMMT